MIKNILRLSILFFIWTADSNAQPVKVTGASCENRINPLGAPLHNIHFSWLLESDERGKSQKAYQLAIASSMQNLQNEKFDVCNSGYTQSNQNINVVCEGRHLEPGTLYYWKVRVRDNDNQVSAWSNIQIFTTGLFDKSDWKGAKWIGYEALADRMRLAPGVPDAYASQLGNKALGRPVTPLFRKTFNVLKNVKSAILFVTGLGQYEISINGKKLDDAFLSPGWTYYDKTVLYNSFDVTRQLLSGKNAIGVIVGNGFYYINRERYFKMVSAFGMPTMICRLKITYEDDTVENIVSDESWKTSSSPITFTSIYGGEDYNASMEQEGWNTAGFDDAQWRYAMLVKKPAGRLKPESDYPVRVMDTISVRKITRLNDHAYLYDFGQNSSGILRFMVKGNKADTIRITPAELVDSSNLPNQNASGRPYYYTYILKGTGLEIWQPKFSYYGFRYALVENAAPDTAGNKSLPSLLYLVSLHTRNSTPATGIFSCSDSLFNKINTLIQWAVKSNLQSVVTDCPHREKLGWLEQDYLMGTSIQYNFDIQLLYRKLVRDMMDAQTRNGLVPDIAPEFVKFSEGFRDSPEWGSAAVILPWFLYQWYGDKESMGRAYPMMKRYIAYLGSKSANHMLSYGLGDWYDYGPGFPGEAQLTPKALTATAIYYYDVLLLGRMATLLHDTAQGQKLKLLAAQIKHAFNQKFFNRKSKVYSTGSQTAMAMPLCVGLVDKQFKQLVLNNLIDSINQSGLALTAGDIGFHFLIKALDDGGASQLIYKMNHHDDSPGYGYQLKKGATALTESWAALQEVSNNHLMLGHIMEWFYRGIAGIGQQEKSTAYKNITIRPQPVGSISSAKASFKSPYGLITSEWKREKNSFSLHLTIPVNTSATVYLPVEPTTGIFEGGKPFSKNKIKMVHNTAVISILSGEYLFEVK